MTSTAAPTSQATPFAVPPSVFTLPQTAQLEALYTIIRDKNTTRSDFLFYSDRIIRLLVEEGLNHLPVVPKTVETPTVRALYQILNNLMTWLDRVHHMMVFNLKARYVASQSCGRERLVICWLGSWIDGVMLTFQAMEAGLREVCRSVRIGKILIQRVYTHLVRL